MKQTIQFSMNGFRRQLTEDVRHLKNLIKEIVNDEEIDKDNLVYCLNEVITKSNVLNCLFVAGDDLFSDMGDVETEPLEDPNS